MKKIINIFLLIVFLVLAGGTIYFLYSKSKEKPVTYDTEQPFRTDIVKKTVANGSVVPRQEIDIKPQVSGIIDKLYVDPGEKVKEGEVIARVRIVPDMTNLNNARSRLKKARIDLDNQKEKFERNKKLHEQGVIAQAEFEDIKTRYENAKEELKAAKDNLRIIKEGVAEADSGESNTLIRSTISGTVLDVPVKKGNSVIESNNFNEGTTIATIADLNDMLFEGKVDESEVDRLHEGMELRIKIGAIQGQTYNGVLEYIAPKGKEEEGAIRFDIEARLKLKDAQFVRAGYSATADIVLAERDSVLAIKESLLQFRENEEPYVEVKTSEGQYQEQELELGISNGINVEVKEGLEKGDKVKVWDKKEKPKEDRQG